MTSTAPPATQFSVSASALVWLETRRFEPGEIAKFPEQLPAAERAPILEGIRVLLENPSREQKAALSSEHIQALILNELRMQTGLLQKLHAQNTEALNQAARVTSGFLGRSLLPPEEPF